MKCYQFISDLPFQKQSATGNVKGLTDTSKYTGSHKLRFDETGKGRGKAGRVDEPKNAGYVANYKGQGTYDKKEEDQESHDSK